MVATTLICALACAVLVEAERTHRETLRFAAKIVASCAFVATAGLAIALGHRGEPAFQGAIVIGLVFGLAGDVALLYRRGFVIGLAVFLAGHVAYAVAVGLILPARAWLPHAGVLALVPAVVGPAIVASLWPRLGKLRGAVIAYVGAIVVMVVAALAAWRANLVPPVFALGAALFFASDIAVARDRFVGKRFANKAWGLPAYYAAQLLIAWSLR